MTKKQSTISHAPFVTVNSKCKMLGNLKKEVELVIFLARRLSRKEAIQTYVSSWAHGHLKSLNSLQGESLLLRMHQGWGAGGAGMRRKEMGKRRHYRYCLGDLFNLSKTFLIKIKVLQCHS